MIKTLGIIIILLSISGCSIDLHPDPVENGVNKDIKVMNRFIVTCNQYNVAYYVGVVQGGIVSSPVLKQDGDTIRYVSCDEIKANEK